MRYAAVTGARSADEVAAYLPRGYEVYGHRFPDGPSGRIVVLIRGEDDAGWTLDDYVIPRLASGLMGCEEAKPLACPDCGSHDFGTNGCGDCGAVDPEAGNDDHYPERL